MNVRISLICCLAVLLCAAPASAKTTPVVDLKRETPVRTYAGWLLFSRWDGSRYHLSTSHEGKVRDLAVPTSEHVFDADVGPDSDGRPSAVVSLCRGSCDLYVIGFEAGDKLRPVRNANTGSHDEIAPSVWKGRLVFGRRYSRDRVVPYTKLLSAPRSHPSSRLSGLPSRRCGAVTPPDCRKIEDVKLGGMELWGRWIAQRWSYQPDGFAGFRQDEVRLTNLHRTDTRQLAYMTTGEGGQTYLGPSIADGRVAFFRACHADRGGCSTKNSGAIRYRISSHAYQLDGMSTGWTGWAWNGADGFHVPSEFDCRGGDPGAPPRERCAIYRRDGLAWAAVASKHVR